MDIVSEFTHRAMATEFAVMLPGPIGEHGELAVTALEVVSQLERKLSIYHPTSEVSQINRFGASRPVRVSSDVIDLLALAKRISELTAGAFDVTAGPLVDCWGFTKKRGAKPTPDAIRAARALVGWQGVSIDVEASAVSLEREGMAINLGAIGKGYALDQVAKRLHVGGQHDFLIHGGSSSVLACGDDIPGSGNGWMVAIAHPLVPKRRLGGVRLINRGLATSGSGKQFFHHQGKRYGHVIDPRTGWPAGDLLSLTVLGPTAAECDALATGWFVEGSACLERCAPLAAIAAAPAMRQGEVELRRYGVPEDIWLEAPKTPDPDNA